MDTELLSDTFVDLADTMVADFDVIDFLHMLTDRNVRRAETLAEQLHAALNSRVVIEQAKGRIAERLGLEMERAFALLRDHARNTNQRLTDVARHLIDSPTADFPPPSRG